MTNTARAQSPSPGGPRPAARRFGRQRGNEQQAAARTPPSGQPPDQDPDSGTAGPVTSGGGPGRGDGQEAHTILESARRIVDPELRRAVDALPTAMRRVARYHFGWEHADGTPAAGNAGKAVRPALVLTAVRALRGRTDSALRAATAVELVHNFTLLHDDVMDRDRTRRHRATAWAVFGDPDAILAGDAMQAQAQHLLSRDSHPAASAAAARLAACIVELCEGQHVDSALESCRPGDVTMDEVLAMAEAKTGALLGCSCAMGGLYAGARPEVVDALDEFGRESGLAFQLIDDVIGIWGDPARTGKPAGADLLSRKKSLPVVAALTSGTPAGAELAELYGQPPGETDLERTISAVERAGGRDWAHEQAADHMSRAVHHLSRAVPDPADAGELLTLAEFVTRRTA